MGNGEKLSTKIFDLVEKLPFFTIENLKILGVSEYYLRIILSRYIKKGEIIRLKKGVYVLKTFVEKTKKDGVFSEFLEFLATEIYSPSYLSLDYILYQNNILTEVPFNFTLITKNKTTSFFNPLGNFFYHKIKDSLFYGFEISREGDFIIRKATKSKALFDFLYLRKNKIVDKRAFRELRLNLNQLNNRDREEFKNYVLKEGSRKMKEIFSFLK